MTPNDISQIEDFLAQVNGTVEALVLAYGGLAATHQDPSKPMSLLNSMLEAAKKREASKELSPAQKAYQAGTIAAVSKLVAAVKLAQDIHAMNQAGPNQ